MKKTLSTLWALTIINFATAQKFSAQFNAGYNYLLGTKQDKLNGDNASLGAYTNGTIPLELEARYYINDNIFTNLNYAYNVDLGYSFNGTGYTQKSSINPQTLKIGGGYYFPTGAFKPYAGLDINVFLVKITNETTIPTGANSPERIMKTVIANQFGAGVGPKIGFDYALNDNLYLNTNLSYNFIFSAVKDKTVSATTTVTAGGVSSTTTGDQRVSFVNSHLVGLSIGVGYKFL